MRCTATGVLADEEVNVDKCKELGDKMLRSMHMVGKNAHNYSSRKKDQQLPLRARQL